MNRHLRLFLALLVSMAGVLTGTDYYVDVNRGNDLYNGLSLTTPWKTVGKANITLVAGDTVYIMNGTYSEQFLPSHSGSARNYITCKSYTGHRPILKGTNQPFGTIYFPAGINYIIVDGITVDGGPRTSSTAQFFVWIEGDHNTIQNCTLTNATDNVDGGVRIYGNYNKVLNCKISHAGNRDLGDVWVEGTYNLVEGCTIFDIGHDTINLFGHHNIGACFKVT